MDKLLAEAARKLFADSLFELVRHNHCEANKGYLNKQIAIASEYLTDEQKNILRSKGVDI